MTPDSEDFRRTHDIGFLVKNARGLAFAAFGSPRQIGQLLGMDEAETRSFQATARDVLCTLQTEARAARRRMGGRQ